MTFNHFLLIMFDTSSVSTAFLREAYHAASYDPGIFHLELTQFNREVYIGIQVSWTSGLLSFFPVLLRQSAMASSRALHSSRLNVNETTFVEMRQGRSKRRPADPINCPRKARCNRIPSWDRRASAPAVRPAPSPCRRDFLSGPL